MTEGLKRTLRSLTAPRIFFGFRLRPFYIIGKQFIDFVNFAKWKILWKKASNFFTRMRSNVSVSVTRSVTQKENVSSACRKLPLTCGLGFIALALFFGFFSNDLIEQIVKKELLLMKSSKSYDLWLESPFPIFIDFYFFNWTNPMGIRLPGYKANFTEVGPFRFRESVKKVDLKWNENGTVTYKKLRKWRFEAQGSSGHLDDEITTLNVVALSAVRSTKYWNKLIRTPLSLALTATQTVDITKTVREFLFEGFTDPLIQFAAKLPGLSSQVPFDKFGWFYKRNGSDDFDGVFNMETGANGFDVLGKLRFWNYKNRTRFYDDHCGDILGSAGEFWPPERLKNEEINLFSPDMCRYISFMYKGEEIFGNLQSYRYESGLELFDNGTLNFQNKCFCVGRCYPSGTLNVSTCRFGAPAFVSYPHFYLADSFYLDLVSGMQPDRKKHEMYIILEKTWGIPLEVAIRLQINLLLEPDIGIGMYKEVPTIFFPIMWFEQKVTMPENMRSELELVLRLPELTWIASICFHFLGFFCIFAVLFTKETKKIK